VAVVSGGFERKKIIRMFLKKYNAKYQEVLTDKIQKYVKVGAGQKGTL